MSRQPPRERRLHNQRLCLSDGRKADRPKECGWGSRVSSREWIFPGTRGWLEVQSTLPRKHWLGIEFRHLAALAAIAEEGSFRAAADRLGYVQSAVSQQIAFLERTLDVRLIERAPGSHPVALTDAGRLILGHFEDILVKLGAAWADVEALSHGRAGAVRVAAPAERRAADRAEGARAARARLAGQRARDAVPRRRRLRGGRREPRRRGADLRPDARRARWSGTG